MKINNVTIGKPANANGNMSGIHSAHVPKFTIKSGEFAEVKDLRRAWDKIRMRKNINKYVHNITE